VTFSGHALELAARFGPDHVILSQERDVPPVRGHPKLAEEAPHHGCFVTAQGVDETQLTLPALVKRRV
jgi:hypothetical protein